MDNVNADSVLSEKEDNVKKPKTIIKKRKVNKDDWKQIVRKRSIAAGEEYVSCNGKVVPARTISECICVRKCTESLSLDEKKYILDSFNAMQNKNLQDSYLFGLITVREINR